jgi:anti-sigma regulatory factor (Ser/Thr protein kinase)
MGQLRNALRAYALEGHGAVDVLGRLDALTHSIEGPELATVVYVVLDPETGRLEYATAGHPPPVVLSPGKEPVLLEEGRGPPLGAMLDSTYALSEARLDPGDTLVLYTDGLVERRDMWIDDGLALLVDHARAWAGGDPGDLVDHLVGTLLGGGRPDDDVAVLALRIDPAPADSLDLTLSADPGVLSSMRQSLRGWLSAVGADEDERYDVLVAATEAAANAVEHAYGPVDATFRLEAHAGGEGAVTLIVRDEGSWRPPRGHNRGRGTLLMQQLMDEFEVTTGDAGTVVRMSKRLVGSLAA